MLLFIGYQGQGSLGYAIQHGATEARIDGQVYPVRCNVRSISGFSAHADEHELEAWVRNFTAAGGSAASDGRPKTVFVVHGDPDAATAFGDRIRKDLVAVRSLAKRLLDLPHADWNDWEIDFLQHMARHKGSDPITTRQCEKLLELRDDAEYYSSVRGFSVQSLIKSCWHARDDLDSEDDRKFIEQLKETSYSCIKRRQLRKLLACARKLGEIEQYVSIDR